MRAVASRWGGGCPGHRTPRPGGSPSPPPVCAGTKRARGGGPGAESRDRAGRLVARAAISSGSRSGSPAGRRLAVSASASRRVTPTPPSAGCTQRSRGGRTTRRRSRLPGHRAARASPASAHWVRRLPDRSAARAAGRCTAGLTRHIIQPEEGCWGGWPIEDLPAAPATPSMPCSASVQPLGHDGLSPAPRTRRPPTWSSHHAASGKTPTVESRCCPQDVEEEGTGPAGPTNVAPRSRRLRPAPRRRRAVSTAAATGGPSGLPPRRGRRPSPRLRPGRRRRPCGRTPGTRAVTGAWACDHVRAGGARPAVVDPHSVNALGVRGSSRFTAESHPAFPLTHDALSECAFRAGDDAWRQHGDRALEILRPITRIAGHHRHHAEVDHCLRSRLEQQP